MATKRPQGRPKRIIDQKQFESLCALQCTEAEICSVLDVSEKTLENWCMETYGQLFSQVFAEKRGIGKVSLRRKQFKLAETNASMAIFLGKNMLGQKDNPGEPTDAEKFARNMVALADIINQPRSDRKIAEFESPGADKETGSKE